MPVARPCSLESTALGAATLAGLAEGVWSSLDELAGLWEAEAVFEPQLPAELTDAAPRRVAPGGREVHGVGRPRRRVTGRAPVRLRSCRAGIPSIPGIPLQHIWDTH